VGNLHPTLVAICLDGEGTASYQFWPCEAVEQMFLSSLMDFCDILICTKDVGCPFISLVHIWGFIVWHYMAVEIANNVYIWRYYWLHLKISNLKLFVRFLFL